MNLYSAGNLGNTYYKQLSLFLGQGSPLTSYFDVINGRDSEMYLYLSGSLSTSNTRSTALFLGQGSQMLSYFGDIIEN